MSRTCRHILEAAQAPNSPARVHGSRAAPCTPLLHLTNG
jgi:hypothetical protein